MKKEICKLAAIEQIRASNGSLGQLLKRKKTLTTPKAGNYFFIYFRDHLFLEK
tara:strand:- start:722 stop:880 length:159 start_codon:yes stop_codon:yes gene_type:complete